MPESMSVERRNLLKAYGAELVLTDAAKGMQGAIDKAEELHAENPESIIAGQFVNPANPQIHYETTGPEIFDDLNGKVDLFISGVGTGGTLTGVGRFLKKQNPAVKIVAVDQIHGFSAFFGHVPRKQPGKRALARAAGAGDAYDLRQ